MKNFLNLSPFLRLFFQILISIIVWSQGIAIDLNSLNLEFFLNNNNELLSLLITSFWIVGITNAINWMDGLDGLASGFTFLAALGFLIVGFISGNDINIIIISSAISGLALGFLKHNFRPAKLYMGDGGSYLLGFNLALLSLLINNHQNLSTKFSPLLIMFIPIFDMCVVIINRIKNGHSPFFPDKSHLHHRIMNYGFDEKKTVFTIYFLSLISISTAVFINL